MNILGWIAMVFSVTGTLFNAKKNIWCWLIWIVANCLWKYYAIATQQWSLLVLWIVFTIANIYAWKEWYKDLKKKEYK